MSAKVVTATARESICKILKKSFVAVLTRAQVKKGPSDQWGSPADSTHCNGAAEAAVCIIKKAFQSLEKEENISNSELQTAFQLAANLANEHIIDARAQSYEKCVQYVTPNTLLLDRASLEGDTGTFDFTSYPYRRLREM